METSTDRQAVRVLVCPDAFKGTATSPDVAASVRRGLDGGQGTPSIHVRCVPLSDGGAGFLHALLAARPDLMVVECAGVLGPLGAPLPCPPRYAVEAGAPRRAYIEMASASGIDLLPHRTAASTADSLWSAKQTTTFGVGQLIEHAVGVSGVSEIVLGLGGSATNDGGLGMLQALGVTVRLSSGTAVRTFLPANDADVVMGGSLLRSEEASPLVVTLTFPGSSASASSTTEEPSSAALRAIRSRAVNLRVVSDVTNPLTGPSGATAVYGPQKGITNPEDIAQLDRGLEAVGSALAKAFEKDVMQWPGAGAAGGVGAALMALTGNRAESGAPAVASFVQLEKHLDWCNVVVTGEGSFDSQTLEYGKTAAHVIALVGGRKTNTPRPESGEGTRRVPAGSSSPAVAVVCGRCEAPPNTIPEVVRLVLPLTPAYSVEDAMKRTTEVLQELVQQHRAEIVALAA